MLTATRELARRDMWLSSMAFATSSGSSRLRIGVFRSPLRTLSLNSHVQASCKIFLPILCVFCGDKNRKRIRKLKLKVRVVTETEAKPKLVHHCAARRFSVVAREYSGQYTGGGGEVVPEARGTARQKISFIDKYCQNLKTFVQKLHGFWPLSLHKKFRNPPKHW